MTDKARPYSQGDWVVHRLHGVGQVKGIVSKRLRGRRRRYYQVRAKDQTLWVPIETMEGSRIRPVASPAKLRQALEILTQPPSQMDPDHNERKRRINEVRADGSLVAICRLVRDLLARKSKKQLTSSEHQVLQYLENRLLGEWSVILGVAEEQARREFHALLQQRGGQDA